MLGDFLGRLLNFDRFEEPELRQAFHQFDLKQYGTDDPAIHDIVKEDREATIR